MLRRTLIHRVNEVQTNAVLMQHDNNMMQLATSYLSFIPISSSQPVFHRSAATLFVSPTFRAVWLEVPARDGWSEADRDPECPESGESHLAPRCSPSPVLSHQKNHAHTITRSRSRTTAHHRAPNRRGMTADKDFLQKADLTMRRTCRSARSEWSESGRESRCDAKATRGWKQDGR